jgi:hypothetical protein
LFEDVLHLEFTFFFGLLLANLSYWAELDACLRDFGAPRR